MVIFLAFIFGFLPSFIWLFFFLKEDDHPEPKNMIAKVFVYGFVIAMTAVIFQYFFKDILGIFNIGENNFISFLVLAGVEEILKFVAVYLSVAKSKFFDESIDAMIYMITAALGFAAMENFFLAADSLIKNGGLSGEIFTILTLRFVGATLLHALSSGIVGYYWAKVMATGQRLVMGCRLLVVGLITATALHAVFNYSIITLDGAKIVFYPLLFLIIIALFIFKDFDKIKITNPNNSNLSESANLTNQIR